MLGRARDAVALVAEAASLPEDREGAGEAVRGVLKGVRSGVGIVEEDRRAVARSRLVDVVEEKVGPVEGLDAGQRRQGHGRRGVGGWRCHQVVPFRVALFDASEHILHRLPRHNEPLIHAAEKNFMTLNHPNHRVAKGLHA